MSTAFALRAEHVGTVPQEVDGDTVDVPAFTGGVIAVMGRDEAFDVRAALEAGDGVIVVDDTDATLIDALTEFPLLKRVPTPEGAEPVNRYAAMTLRDLRAEAKSRGLEGAGKVNKPELELALAAHDDRLAAGDADVAASPDHPVNVGDVVAGQEA